MNEGIQQGYFLGSRISQTKDFTYSSSMSFIREWPLRPTTIFVCRECFPVAGGFLPHVIGLIDEYLDEFLDQRVFESACEGGADVNTLEFLLTFTVPDWGRAVKAATRGGHLHVFEWMWMINGDKGGPWRPEFRGASNEAERYGHLDVLRWLISNNLGHLSSDTMHEAAANGQLEIVRWLDEHHPETRSVKAIRHAAEHGHLEVVQWLHKHIQSSESGLALMDAAGHAQMGVMQWLYQNNCTTHVYEALGMAVRGGHSHDKQWLYGRGSKPFDLAWVIDSAYGSGNLELVKWLDELSPGQFTWRGMYEAAHNGHLEVVKWLHGRSCDGSVEVMNSAASNGHLAVVKWLHENRQDGCTASAMDGAARHGHLDVVQWLHRHRSEGCTYRGTISAAMNGHLEIVRFLYDNDINRLLDEQGRHAADHGQLELLQVLVWKQGLYLECSISTHWSIRVCVEKMLREVRSYGRAIPPEAFSRNQTLRKILDVMESLHSHHYLACVSSMLLAALKCGYPSLVESFFSQKSTDGCIEYLKTSRNCEDRALKRWLLQKISQNDISFVIDMIVRDGQVKDVEVMCSLSESDRTQVVCDAIRKEWKGLGDLLQWTFNHTAFNDAASRTAIRAAIKDAPKELTQWLVDDIENTEVLHWCLPAKRCRLAV